MGSSFVRRDPRRQAVGVTRFIVAPLKLPGRADGDPWAGRFGAERRRPLVGGAGGRGRLGGEMGSTELHPAVGI